MEGTTVDQNRVCYTGASAVCGGATMRFVMHTIQQNFHMRDSLCCSTDPLCGYIIMTSRFYEHQIVRKFWNCFPSRIKYAATLGMKQKEMMVKKQVWYCFFIELPIFTCTCSNDTTCTLIAFKKLCKSCELLNNLGASVLIITNNLVKSRNDWRRNWLKVYYITGRVKVLLTIMKKAHQWIGYLNRQIKCFQKIFQ